MEFGTGSANARAETKLQYKRAAFATAVPINAPVADSELMGFPGLPATLRGSQLGRATLRGSIQRTWAWRLTASSFPHAKRQRGICKELIFGRDMGHSPLVDLGHLIWIVDEPNEGAHVESIATTVGPTNPHLHLVDFPRHDAGTRSAR